MSFLDKVKSTIPQKTSSKKNDLEAVESSDQTKQKKIEDILEILQIPSTFEIPSEVFLPEDLKDVQFDVQIPSGYDTGQVTRFVHQAKLSISFLVDIVKRRNDDIAKLATTIDKLQVDTNNLRFENEIANGISLMPTEDDANLENQLMEAKLLNKRLEDKIRTLEESGAGAGSEGMTSGEKEAYIALQDEFSLLKRKNSSLSEENLNLKNRIAHLEDYAEDELNIPAPEPQPLTPEELAELGLVMDDRSKESVITNVSLPPTEGLPKPSGLSLPPSSEISDVEDYSPPSSRSFDVFDDEDDPDPWGNR